MLIRAIEPTTGIATMGERRKLNKISRRLTGGPGCVSQALGVCLEMDNSPLNGPLFWITNACIETGLAAQNVPIRKLIASTRVGVESAGESALLPWRFRIKDNRWTSPAK